MEMFINMCVCKYIDRYVYLVGIAEVKEKNHVRSSLHKGGH